MTHTRITLTQRPELIEQMEDLDNEAWPHFFSYNQPTTLYWKELFTKFTDFQFAIYDAAGNIVGAGHTIPIYWDGTVGGLPSGWDQALEQGAQHKPAGYTPNTLCALSAVVAAPYKGQGVSYKVLEGMRTLAAEHSLRALIAPVRPNLKDRYPLTPFERYIQWKRKDGQPFDPWLRAHWRLGAEQLAISPQSMVFTGTVTEWEEWTDMHFPESGPYVVPGMLQPLQINCEQNNGRYDDPNLWMRHSVG